MLRISNVTLKRFALSFLACLLCLSILGGALAEEAPAENAGEAELSDENLFDRSDPYFVEGYNFIQATDQITLEPDSFITGFIPVEPGNIVSVNLNSTKNSEFIKYALYDTNKNWTETVKVDNVSELTIRIFEPGFIRLSVYNQVFERTLSIYITMDRQEERADQDTLLMSNNNTNIVVKTSDEDPSDYYTDRFDRSDPDFLDEHNFEQTTEKIVEEPDSFITGYIPVMTGDAITLTLDEEKISAFVKYALYDTNKTWSKTVRTNSVREVTLTIQEPGFIRFSVYGRHFRSSASIFIHPAIRLSADQQIEETILPALINSTGHNEAFDTNYLSDETIDLFDITSADFLMDKGYSQLTEEIVDDEGSFITGYIPVVSGQVIIVTITESTAFAKYALYDHNKQWLSTTRVDQPTLLVVPVEETGYFRFHGYQQAINCTSITIPSVTKVDINAISGNIESRLARLEDSAHVRNEVDVVIFMGQSNMAGRGAVTEEHPEDAPEVMDGAGWEFRAISNPKALFRITKTFGLYENVEGAINDGAKKTGGMVPAFVNAYYAHNGKVPVICVSASEGNTSMKDWEAGTPRLSDAVSRLQTCVQWLTDNGYEIRHQYMIWCQGESDDSQTEDWYIDKVTGMFAEMHAAGVEKCFIIRVGNTYPATEARVEMMQWQNHLCQQNPDMIMISNSLCTMLDRGLMQDHEHYFQAAYNECGEEAGNNMAYYVTTGKKPMMYDPQFGELYYAFMN